MRFVIQVVPAAEPVEGTVVAEESGRPVPFSGWLELLRVLEDAIHGGDPR